MTHISTPELSKGILLVVDGGSYNNQSPNRVGYGSFRVFKDGDWVPSTFNDVVDHTHYFEFGKGVTNSVAEVSMMLKALAYVTQLVERGYQGTVRIAADSQNAILAATTDIKKPAAHLKGMYRTIRVNVRALGKQVQFVKIHESEVKQLLGH